MDKIKTLEDNLKNFEENIKSKKELFVHENNKFNKQFSSLITDLTYIKIITERIEETDTDDISQLKLDLKSLYVFGRVFSESILYTASLFINSSEKIKWDKIGPFIKNSKENVENESDEFKEFWVKCSNHIENLCEAFKYRNFVLHEKNSNTEWTMTWPGRSNLDYVYIANVPWKEDQKKRKEVKSINANKLIEILKTEIPPILDYLKSIS